MPADAFEIVVASPPTIDGSKLRAQLAGRRRA
jgi:hypothetical protein